MAHARGGNCIEFNLFNLIPRSHSMIQVFSTQMRNIGFLKVDHVSMCQSPQQKSNGFASDCFLDQFQLDITLCIPFKYQNISLRFTGNFYKF